MKTKQFCKNLFWGTGYAFVFTAFSSYVAMSSSVLPVMAKMVVPAPESTEKTVTAWADSEKLPPGFVDAEIQVTSEDGQNDLKEATGKKKTFIISAYYSPLPGQARYVTGSYAGDIRLNGDGVKSADGTQVYPGMVAAPKSYAFGTKMEIPGIGTVAVHDRGGAIVHTGERGNAYDRLDVWMGYGDAGLKRALKWGKRTVEVTLYGVNPDIIENVYLEGYSEAEKNAVANTLTPGGEGFTLASSSVETDTMVYGPVLSPGDSGDAVRTLQQKLKDGGFYTGEIDGNFHDETLKAVKRFQVSQKIVPTENSYGAGYVGPKTLKVLASGSYTKNTAIPSAHAAEETITVPDAFKLDLKPGDRGEDVKNLQAELNRINLLGIEPTGVYGEVTEHAVFKFQQINKLAGDTQSPGAGIFGPMTRNALNALVAEREKTAKIIANRKIED
jgi:peptidoglycan hydrolase-like protein with peptidoglycan-binding domain/3D (Asp-Asp-Asp) domain-containing protein